MRFEYLVCAAMLCGVSSAALAAEAADADQPSNQTIVVTGTREGDASLGALGAKSILDTPFSVGSFDAQIIKDTQATTLADLLKFEPGATVAPDVAEFTTFSVRGFGVHDYYIDSVPGFGSYATTEPVLEFYDNVQILKGAAGFLYGFTSPGGILNLVTKRPVAEPFLTLTSGFEQNSLYRAHIDTGIASSDGRFGTRLNIVGENGRDRYIDAKRRRYAIALNTDIQVTPTTTFQLDLLHSRRRLFGDSFGFFTEDNTGPVPKPISGTSRLAPDFSNYRDDVDRISPSVIQQLGSGWVARIDTSWTRDRRNYHDSELDGLQTDGDYTLGLYTANYKVETKAAQLLVSGTARTGPVEHALALGGYYQHTKTRNALDTSDGCCLTVGPGNINGPVPNFPDPGLDNPSLAQSFIGNELIEKAVFVSDTLSVGTHWQLLLGGRYVWREAKNFNTTGSRTFYDKRSKLTPTGALLWKPVPNVTTYVSYAQSLQAGGTAPVNAENANQQFPPVASKQYEAGIKAQLGALLVTAAAFRIEQGFGFLKIRPAPLRPLYVQDGIQRHDGVEFGVSGKIAKAWRLSGGLQLLDPTIREGDPALEGKTPSGVPKVQAKLFGEYAPPVFPGAAINASVVYSSDNFLDPTNLQRVDGFTTFDVGARYRFNAATVPVTLRASVENVFAKRYWTPGQLLPGAPRSLKLSAEVAF